tara:strand:+ start:148 stop:417 length:270 start_codon:yes stop_codon:yes gene_type:complete
MPLHNDFSAKTFVTSRRDFVKKFIFPINLTIKILSILGKSPNEFGNKFSRYLKGSRPLVSQRADNKLFGHDKNSEVEKIHPVHEDFHHL